MAVPSKRSVEEWREILSGAKVTVFEAIYGAIEVAMADFPDKLMVERDTIARRLYTFSTTTTCNLQKKQQQRPLPLPMQHEDHHDRGQLIKKKMVKVDDDVSVTDEESSVVDVVSGGSSNLAMHGNYSGSATPPRIKIKCRFQEDKKLLLVPKENNNNIQILIKKTDQAASSAAELLANRRNRPPPPLALEKKINRGSNSMAAMATGDKKLQHLKKVHFISDDTEFDKLLDRKLLPKKNKCPKVRPNPNSSQEEEDQKVDLGGKRKFQEAYDEEIELSKKVRRIKHDITAVNVREEADHNNLPTKKKGLSPGTTTAAAKKKKLTSAKDRICKVLFDAEKLKQ